MDAVFLCVEFQNFQKLLLVAEHIYSLSGIFRNLLLEYPEPVFWAEGNVVFAFIDIVCAYLLNPLTHLCTPLNRWRLSGRYN